jgi:phosphoribosylaminoimidazole-succinocarboxamide synthase
MPSAAAPSDDTMLNNSSINGSWRKSSRQPITEARQANGEAQKQLSKEFVRQWLIENGFQGLDGQQMPFMPDDFVQTISERYIELYERITGLTFEKSDTQNIVARIENNVNAYLQNN